MVVKALKSNVWVSCKGWQFFLGNEQALNINSVSAHWLKASCLLNATDSELHFHWSTGHIFYCLRLALCLTSVLCFNCVVPALPANFVFPACSGFRPQNLQFMEFVWDRNLSNLHSHLFASTKTVFSSLLRHTCVFRFRLIRQVMIWVWHTTRLIGEKITPGFHQTSVRCIMALIWFCSAVQQPPPVAFWVYHGTVLSTTVPAILTIKLATAVTVMWYENNTTKCLWPKG